MPMYRLPSSIKLDTKITSNHRFTTYRGTLDREPVFIKIAARTETIPVLTREIYGLQYLQDMIMTDDKAPFDVPELLGFGKNYIITSYIEGEPAKAIYPNMDLLVRSFAWIDRTTYVNRPGKTRFSLANAQGSNIAARLAGKLKVTPYKQYFEKELIDKSLDECARMLGAFVPRFTHADLSHKHILLPSKKDDFPAVIDFESCSVLWPRFYDVVNYALKFLYRFPYDSEFANAFMEQYFTAIGDHAEKHADELKGLILIRALSAIHEHLGPVDVQNNSEKIMDKDMSDILSDILKKTLKGSYVFKAAL